MSSLKRLSMAAIAGAITLFGSRGAWAAGNTVEGASVEQRKEAGNLYAAAMADFGADRYEAALRGFRESYAIVKSPNSHFMIARTLAKLGRNAEAYEELEAVIAEATALGSKYEDTVTAARAKEEEIRPRIGLLRITVRDLPKGTKVTAGGEPVDPGQFGRDRPVLPGNTLVAFTMPNGAHGEKTAHLDGGGSATVELSPDLVPQKTPPPEASSFIERDAHGRHVVEIDAHLAIETLEPPGRAARGVGPGGRVGVTLLPQGFLTGLNDEFAVTAGADWIATSNEPHVLVPVAAQYSIWLTQEISAMLEPGLALLAGAGTHVVPVFDVGVRLKLVSRLHFVAKVGMPTSTFGVGWFQ